VIRAAGVVVPAHNEEDLLPACLTAVRAALAQAGLTAHLVVVADACQDQTAARARAAGATVLETTAANVGAARAAGMAEILRQAAPHSPAEIWLATTDADTIVPPAWLRDQLRYAAAGWQAVVGTVTVADWAGHPPEVPPLFRQRYGHGPGPHPHVHGANLGFSAAAYLAAGGFTAARTAEDHELVRAMDAAGTRILRTTAVTVTTSARRRARAPHGFSHLLAALAAATAAASYPSRGQPSA
jgi:glycosyltransferase involved in cell wall biosynthesis